MRSFALCCTPILYFRKNIVKSVVLGNIAIQIHNYTENNIFMTLYVQTLFVNKSTSNDNAVNQINIQCCIERDVTLVQKERLKK